MHVLNIKMFKVLNPFIMQIHIFFFLFFYFLSGRDHMLNKVRCLFAIELLFTRKTTQNACFLMAGKYQREHFGTYPWSPLHSFSFIDQLLHFSRGFFFPLDVTPHFLQMSRFIKYESTNFVFFGRSGGALSLNSKSGGAEAPLVPPISPPLLSDYFFKFMQMQLK